MGHQQPPQRGAAFPGNDWITSPGGYGYLSKLVNPSPQLLNELAALRQKHLKAVAEQCARGAGKVVPCSS